MTYDEIEQDMTGYLKANLLEEKFANLQAKVDPLNQESRLCELLLDVIHYAEDQMDRHVTMFDEILTTVNRIKDMDYDGTNFRVI